MLLHRDAIRTVVAATLDGATRPALNGVRVTHEEMVATDGHILIRVPRTALRHEDFPAAKAGATEPFDSPVTIPAKPLLEAAKATPKRANIPVLACVAVEANGHPEMVSLRATDLDREHVAVVRDLGIYPDWRKVIPTGEPVFRIGLTVSVLQKLLKAFQAAGVEHVRVEFRSPVGAVVLAGQSTELGEVSGLIMPARVEFSPVTFGVAPKA